MAEFTKEVIEPQQAAMMAEYERNINSVEFNRNYTTDCEVIMWTRSKDSMKHNGKFRGHEGVKNMIKEFAYFGEHDYKMELTGICKMGDDIGWTEGAFSVILRKDAKVAHSGRYLTIWKKVDGQWKVHRDFHNADPPTKP